MNAVKKICRQVISLWPVFKTFADLYICKTNLTDTCFNFKTITVVKKYI